jgi:DNA-binding GntR family transcriptional regulator
MEFASHAREAATRDRKHAYAREETGCQVVTDSEIREWERSGSAAKRIAADLATMISTGKLDRFASLPDSDQIALKWSVSQGTVTRAKRLLAERGLVKLTRDRHYYVA